MSTVADFATKIRNKYPGAYDDLDDTTLTKNILLKYPTYKDMVAESPFTPLGDDPLSTISKEAHKFNLQVGSTHRTKAEQQTLINQGRTKATNSYHLYGTAADIKGGTPQQRQQFHDYMKNTYGTNLAELIYGTSDHLDHVHVAWNLISNSKVTNKVDNTINNKELIKPSNVNKSNSNEQLLSNLFEKYKSEDNIPQANEYGLELQSKYGWEFGSVRDDNNKEWPYIKPPTQPVEKKLTKYQSHEPSKATDSYIAQEQAKQELKKKQEEFVKADQRSIIRRTLEGASRGARETLDLIGAGGGRILKGLGDEATDLNRTLTKATLSTDEIKRRTELEKPTIEATGNIGNDIENYYKNRAEETQQSQAIRGQDTASQAGHIAGSVAPYMIPGTGQVGFGIESALQHYGQGSSLDKSILAGIMSVAGARAAGELANEAETLAVSKGLVVAAKSPENGLSDIVKRYMARVGGQSVGLPLIQVGTGQGVPTTPKEMAHIIAMAMGFGIAGHNKIDSLDKINEIIDSPDIDVGVKQELENIVNDTNLNSESGKYKPEDVNTSTIEDNPINIKLGDRLVHPNGYDIKVVGIGDNGISIKKVGQGKHKPMLVTKDSPVYDSITQQARMTSEGLETEQGKIPQSNQPILLESQPASQPVITESSPALSVEPESKSLGTVSPSQFPKELSNEAGSISPDVLNKMTGGVGQFILKDVGGTIDKAYRAGKEVLNYLVPTKGVSKVGMDIMTEMKGERDEAIAKLQLRMSEAKDMFNKLPNDDNVAFMDKIKKGETQPTPELQEIADFYRTIDNEVYTQLRKYNNVPYLENHFRILWDTIPGEPQPVGLVQNIKTSVLSRRPLQGSKGMLKQHTLNTVSEGIDKGGIPVSYNPQTLFELSYIDAMKYITAQRMWEVLKDNGLRKFVKLGDKAPEGFRPISDSIATVYFPAKSGEGLVHNGKWMVEDNVARILENHLSRDYIRESELGKGIVDIKNLQTMAELGLSSFHAVFEGLESVGSQFGEGFREITNVGLLQANPKALISGTTKILTAPAAPVTTARIGGSVIKYLKNPDEFLASTRGHSFIKAFPDAKRMISDLFMGGGQIAINEGYRTGWRDSMQSAWKEGNYLGSGLRSLPAGVEKLMSPLFETYIPRLKIGTFLKEYQLALQENNKALSTGELTRTELARKTWNFVEDRFGEMNFDNLWWNNTFKTANQVMFRSVTWKLGNLRASAGASPEQAIGIVKDIKQGSIPKLSPKMAWLFGMSLTTAVLGSVISKASTGKYPWQWVQQDEGNIALNIAKETIFPRTSKDNPSQRVSTPTYWKDSFQLIHSPKNYIKSALSSTIGDLADIWNNEDFYGNWVYNPNDNIFKEGVDITKHFFPMPFSIQRYVEAKQKGESTGAALEGFAGITKAPYYIREPQKAAMYEKRDEYIHTLMKKHKGMSKNTATKIVDNELRKH